MYPFYRYVCVATVPSVPVFIPGYFTSNIPEEHPFTNFEFQKPSTFSTCKTKLLETCFFFFIDTWVDGRSVLVNLSKAILSPKPRNGTRKTPKERCNNKKAKPLTISRSWGGRGGGGVRGANCPIPLYLLFLVFLISW